MKNLRFFLNLFPSGEGISYNALQSVSERQILKSLAEILSAIL